MAQFFSLVKPAGVPMPTVAETLKKSAQLDALLAAPLAKGESRMSKLAEMADRAKAMRERLTRLADERNARMGDLQQRGDAAIEQMDRVLAEQEKDVAALETELRQMTNES